MKKVLAWIGVAVLLVALSYVSFIAQRNLNYAASYQDKVRETVRDMVKPECLRP